MLLEVGLQRLDDHIIFTVRSLPILLVRCLYCRAYEVGICRGRRQEIRILSQQLAAQEFGVHGDRMLYGCRCCCSRCRLSARMRRRVGRRGTVATTVNVATV